MFVLLSLSLRYNALGPRAGAFLARALRACESLVSLDLGNNRLGDRGGYQIIDALVEPDPDLLLRQELGVDSSDDEPADGEGDSRPPSRAGAGRSASTAPSPAAGAELDGYVELPPVDRTRCNGSLTALSLQSNDVAQRSMNRLAQLLKTNRTLGQLDVAFNPRLGAAETRQVCAMIRLYNDCLGSLAIGQLPMGDELDEQNSGVNTRTYFFNVEDLNNPFLAGTYTATTAAIDHNLYIKDGIAYQSNYRAGLRMLDVNNPLNPEEVGFFDLYPSSDAASFNGTWSNYPYFSSGVVAVSHIEEGLFLLKPNFFTVSTAADLVCYNETVTITLVNGAATASSTYSVSGVPAGASVNVSNTADGATITVSGFPQGPITPYTLTVSDNTGQSGSVTFSVYDCDSEILGCTDPGALNYNAAATIDDGSCTYPCTDVTVTILTDNYPGETTWAVTDESGATVTSAIPAVVRCGW